MNLIDTLSLLDLFLSGIVGAPFFFSYCTEQVRRYIILTPGTQTFLSPVGGYSSLSVAVELSRSHKTIDVCATPLKREGLLNI